MIRQLFAATVLLISAAPLMAQQTYTLTEAFAKDAHYFVRCDVNIAGSLTMIPVKMVGNQAVPDKDKPTTLKLAGKSTIAYDERILQVNADRRVERTIRVYKQLDFERKVGNQDQQSRLRPEVNRLVILRHNQYEVPFSPTRPLLWGEIELVRTDVFVPALAGLLPAQAVAPGARWNADRVAVQELTDLDKIDEADLVCTFDKIFDWDGRPTALIRFKGNVKGVGEDGNAHHMLDGEIRFDVQARYIRHIGVGATHIMYNREIDKEGRPVGPLKEVGRISGTLAIQRGAPQSSDLSDAALNGLKLEPTPDNTMLVFEHPQVNARFVYPRNWRVGLLNDKQIAVDERRGSGLLISIGAATQTPTIDKFHKDTREWLSKQPEAKVLKEESPKGVTTDVHAFSFDTELGKSRERILLQYYALRQGNQGATVAGRFTQTDIAAVQREAERIVRSLQLSK